MSQPTWTAPAPVAPPAAWPAVAPAKPPVLPVEWRQYHEFWRAPAYRWWKGLLALLLAAGIIVPLMLGLSIPMVMEQMRDGQLPTDMEHFTITPLGFLMNNLSIAVFIPGVMLAAWACTGQRPRWMSSVTGGLRWRWLGRVAMVLVPLWVLYNAVETGVTALLARENPFAGLHLMPHTWFTLATIVCTTVFQCAGEEYLCRGLVPRVLGSWVPNRRAGLVVGWLVSSALFMALHLAGDPMLNIFYFSFATAATWLTWRTGGLEAAIVLHCVNNLLAEATMPFIDYSGMFDRSLGTGGPWWGVLIIVPALVLACAVVEWLIRRHRPVNVAAPGLALASSPAPSLAG